MYGFQADIKAAGVPDLPAILDAVTRNMSAWAGAIRDTRQISRWMDEHGRLAAEITAIDRLPTPESMLTCYLLRDTLTVQGAILTAMTDFSEAFHFSRGSALYTDRNGTAPKDLQDIFAFTLPETDTHRKIVQTVQRSADGFRCHYRPVREIPPEEDCFETVWQEFRERSQY